MHCQLLFAILGLIVLVPSLEAACTIDANCRANGDTSATCTVATSVCVCSVGFSGTHCDDINECSTNFGGCSQFCTNNVGSFVCSCRDGYRLNVDARTCDDINECTETADQGGCTNQCNNIPGGYYCSCPPGWVRGSTRMTCDVDAHLWLAFGLTTAWIADYEDKTSTAYMNLHSSVLARVQGNSPTPVAIRIFFSQSAATRVLVDVKVRFPDKPSHAELSHQAWWMYSRLAPNFPGMTANFYDVDGDVWMKNAQDGRLVTSVSVNQCFLYIAIGYCQNGATCAINNYRPYCVCAYGWTGGRCNIPYVPPPTPSPPQRQLPWWMIIIIIIIIIIFFMALFAVIYVCLLARAAAKQKMRTEMMGGGPNMVDRVEYGSYPSMGGYGMMARYGMDPRMWFGRR